jgi:hypothetical protein
MKNSDFKNIEIRQSRIEGIGIFAERKFQEGERIRQVNIVREVTDKNPLREDEGELLEHCAYPKDKVVLWGYPDRHVNHCCDPNAYEFHEDDVVSIVARRDIEIGEEITFDYNINTSGGSTWPCNCGAVRCRGESIGDFFKLPFDQQQEYRTLLADWFLEKHKEKITFLDDE